MSAIGLSRNPTPTLWRRVRDHGVLRHLPLSRSCTTSSLGSHRLLALHDTTDRPRKHLHPVARNFGSTQVRYKSKVRMTESTQNPLSGLWKPSHLQQLFYGPDCVKQHLLECLPSEKSKAFIITGSSLANKTSLIKDVEGLLESRHAGTFADIKQHAPVAQLDQATEKVINDDDIDTIISVGGGSPIDSAKAISFRLHEKSGRFLHHVAIPTTLSAAECTFLAGYTNEEGQKTGVNHPELPPHAILYDSKFALETPPNLWLSTGFRALDHAMELMYHPTASEMPARQMCLNAVGDLFRNLPKYKQDPKDEDVITRLQLASYASLGFIGYNLKGGLGLSHALGYALGSPYGIPHGITSCMTLGHVIKLKAQDPEAASQLARICPFIGVSATGDDKTDAEAVGQAVLDLAEQLGLKKSVREYGVGNDQKPVITKLATRSESGPLYDAVYKLVEGLYY